MKTPDSQNKEYAIMPDGKLTILIPKGYQLVKANNRRAVYKKRESKRENPGRA